MKFSVLFLVVSFSLSVRADDMPVYGTAPDGTACVDYLSERCPAGSKYESGEDNSSGGENGGMPVKGVAPDGTSCINNFPFFCPPGSTYPDELGKDTVNSGGNDAQTDDVPIYGTAPDGTACVDYLSERCPAGSTYEVPEAPTTATDSDSGYENGSMPVHGIDPDGKPCVNTFPFFCPPGSKYPEQPKPDTGEKDGVATAEDIAKVALDYGASMLTGDAKSACEALLCLAAALTPPECRPSLTKYFSIVLKTITRTIRARKAFLALCPIANDDGIPKLIDDIANGAGSCTLDALNSSAYTGDIQIISSNLPGVCESYYSNPLIQQEKPVYVGVPEKGGFWTTPADYEDAKDRYEKNLREKEQYEKDKYGDR
ncbi:TrbM/KikA/MpfK family conjugal transfer protein [Delftia sp. GW456-R20]|uniref:TrbM/KikA/MpfK family conjugal transfer protein n=1 Tax=Delftia sp. GW456-R20 TaxID=1827145 RepID=UPI0018D44373|nr:TrbM/KikA/MpfK family conjugal transfer protein [Delftia sp. GW456-R20]